MDNEALEKPDLPQQTELDTPIYDTAAPRNRVLDELIDLSRYRELLRNMILTKITARYKRSVLGVLWALLDPLLTMLVMAIVFSALFARAIPAYPVFLLSGLVAWNFISQSTSQAIADLMYGGHLMGRIYMPRATYAVAALGTGLVHLTISLVPLVLIMLIFGMPITPSLLFVPIAVLIIAAFSLGFGLFMSAFAVYFADLLNVHGILLRLLMYLSAIFYTLEMLPPPLRAVVAANPLTHMIALFRDPIYLGSFPSLLSVVYASAFATVVLLVGFWAFMRLSDEIAYRV